MSFYIGCEILFYYLKTGLDKGYLLFSEGGLELWAFPFRELFSLFVWLDEWWIIGFLVSGFIS